MFDLDLGQGLALTACRVDESSVLLAGEQHLLSPRAVPRRQAELAAGRTAARQALEQLGIAATPVLKGPGGEPLWPDRIVGSITHAGEWALAIVARPEHSAGIGIDLEELSRYFPELIDEIAFDEERTRIEGLEESARAHAAMEVFAVKESIYKAFFPRVGRFFGFDAVRVMPAAGGYQAAFVESLDPAYPPGDHIDIGIRWFDDLILAWLVLPPGR